MEELLKKLGKMNYYVKNIDEIMLGRERDIFRHEWERVAFEIELMKDLNGYTKDQERITTTIKETASKKVYEATGDRDLADCVFHDFGILSDGSLLGYKDEWFTKFRNCYEAKIIPTGEL